MRRALLALALAATSFALPSQANAIYCGELDAACRLVCEIKPPCVR